MWKTFLVVGALLLGVGRAGAEIVGADSLEWMAVDAQLIVRGRVLAHKDTKGEGDVVYRDLTVRVDETLKGKIDPGELVPWRGKPRGARPSKAASALAAFAPAPRRVLGVRLRLFKGDKTGADWQASGRSYLFFLRRAGAEEEKELAGKVTPRRVLGPGQPLAIDLHAPEGVFTADMKVATDAKGVLDRVSAQVRKGAGRAHTRRLKPVPDDSPIHRHLYSGSSCYLIVPAPADEEARLKE